MSQNQSNIFVKIHNTTTNNREFKYPLQSYFERNRFDSNSGTYIVVDKLMVNLQQGCLIGSDRYAADPHGEYVYYVNFVLDFQTMC